MEMKFEYKNHKYILNNSNGKQFSIYEFNEENEIQKVLNAIFNFDIGFKLYNFKDSDINHDQIVIEKNNPLYTLFLNLLKDTNELIIDDDATNDVMNRYLKIDNNGDININFHDDKSVTEIDKFSVNVKNITYDLRSKIDQNGLDTKDRLRTFFTDLDDVFMANQSYQKIKTF